MATKNDPLPETIISPETGETLTRGVRPFTIAYTGESVVVDLPGYYPTGEGEGVHIGKDLAVVDQVLGSQGKDGRRAVAGNDPASACQ